ncbi:Exportin-1 [Dictyocoela roeselum]|nr:Exportin-1 [Dictyocoela roeselum]
MSILNGNETFNIAEFDALVLDALSPSSPSKSQSEKALMQFKDSPSSIALIDTILRNSKQKESILFALMTLDEAVRTRWLAFSDEQRAGMKAYFISLIVGSCGGDDIVLKKLDQILIQVLKKEWPDRWPGFIDEIIAASQSQIDICANTLVIFRLLHDQVASENYELVESMTTIKKIKISRQLRLEIPKILDFIQRILQSDAKDQLLKPSLQCLRSIFEEIDEDFLFGSEIIEIILYHISQAPVEVVERLLVISKYKIRGAIFNSQNEEIDSKTCSCLSEELCYHPKQAPENMKSEKLNLIHRTTIQFLNIYFEGKDDLPTVYPTLVAEERQFIKTFSHFLANFYQKN